MRVLPSIQGSGFFYTVKKTAKEGGMKEFYRGVGLVCLGGGPASALFFGSYAFFTHVITMYTPISSLMLTNFLAANAAEATSCIFWVPIDVIKERLQIQSNTNLYSYKNSIDAVASILKNESYLSLYKAYGATILAFGPFIGINMSLYEKTKSWRATHRMPDSFFFNFISAFLSGAAASFVTNPLDVARLRLQIQRYRAHPDKVINPEKINFDYKNTWDGIIKIVNKEGVLALWRGCLARIIHMSAQAAVNLSLLDKVRNYLLAGEHKYKN